MQPNDQSFLRDHRLGGGFGDSARDFSYVLFQGGWSFFQRVVDAYDLPLDAEFADRTLFSARLGRLGWLADVLKRGGTTSRYVAIVRRVFELEQRGITSATAASILRDDRPRL